MSLRVLTLTALLVLASEASALSVDNVETFVLGCFAPPALAPHPTDPGVAFVACSKNPIIPQGVFALSVRPDAPLGLASGIPPFLLPGDLSGEVCGASNVPFIDDVWIERTDLAWLTTSDCETVLPYDPETGERRPVRFEGLARPAIPTSLQIQGSFTRTDGVAVTRFTTNFTSGVVRVGSRLLVTSSNFSRPGTVPVLYPGTVLLFDVVEEPDGTLSVTRAEPPYLVTTDPNPTALTPLPDGLVAVTNTGLLNLLSPPVPGGPGSIDIVDPQRGTILANLPLGEAAPAFRGLALDPTGSVAVVGSGVFRELYALDIRGLSDLPTPPADPTLQRPSCHGLTAWETDHLPCLRERVIAGPGDPLAPPIALPGESREGFVPEVRFDPTGRFMLATQFNAGRLAVVPVDLTSVEGWAPILSGRFGAAVSSALTPPLGTPGAETGPGPFILVPSGEGGLGESALVWVTNGPDGTVMRGTLREVPAEWVADSDEDGIADVEDRCPRVPESDPVDGDGDGVGDACDLCPAHPNPRGLRLPHETRRDGQRDDDGDGYGNACDGDFDPESAWVNVADLLLMLGAFGQAVTAPGCPGASEPVSCAVYDLNEQGSVVNVSDLLKEIELFGSRLSDECPGCLVPCAGPACTAVP